jgi:hypothetical protein
MYQRLLLRKSDNQALEGFVTKGAPQEIANFTRWRW